MTCSSWGDRPSHASAAGTLLRSPAARSSSRARSANGLALSNARPQRVARARAGRAAAADQAGQQGHLAQDREGAMETMMAATAHTRDRPRGRARLRRVPRPICPAGSGRLGWPCSGGDHLRRADLGSVVHHAAAARPDAQIPSHEVWCASRSRPGRSSRARRGGRVRAALIDFDRDGAGGIRMTVPAERARRPARDQSRMWSGRDAAMSRAHRVAGAASTTRACQHGVRSGARRRGWPFGDSTGSRWRLSDDHATVIGRGLARATPSSAPRRRGVHPLSAAGRGGGQTGRGLDTVGGRSCGSRGQPRGLPMVARRPRAGLVKDRSQFYKDRPRRSMAPTGRAPSVAGSAGSVPAREHAVRTRNG